MFSNGQETRPWLCPYEVINITSTAQGYDAGPDITQIAREMQCVVVCVCCPSVTPCVGVYVFGDLHQVWSAGRR